MVESSWGARECLAAGGAVDWQGAGAARGDWRRLRRAAAVEALAPRPVRLAREDCGLAGPCFSSARLNGLCASSGAWL